MAGKRKKQSTLRKAASKKQKRPTEPIQSIPDSHTQVPQAEAISKLPSELLTQVLSYILTKSSPVTLHSANYRRWRNEVFSLSRVYSRKPAQTEYVRSPLLNILLVSRAFYFAGIAAFFGENVLEFNDILHLNRLTSKLDLDRRRCMRRITFDFPFRDEWCSKRWALWPEAQIVGERLGVCLERLPSLVQVLFCWSPTNRFHSTPQEYLQTLTKTFEEIKEFCGSRRELLELDSKDSRGNEWVAELEDPDL